MEFAWIKELEIFELKNMVYKFTISRKSNSKLQKQHIFQNSNEFGISGNFNSQQNDIYLLTLLASFRNEGEGEGGAPHLDFFLNSRFFFIHL